jgi:hypothetical protein
MKLAAASQSGRNWSTAGDVLKLAAMVTGMHALTKAPEAAAQTTVDTPNIGAQIQAAKGPSWMAPGQSFGKYAPELAGDGVAHFGSNYGLAAANKGALDAWGLSEPMSAFGPLRSGLVQPTTPAGVPINPHPYWGNDNMLNPLYWLGKRKPTGPYNPVMY